MCVCVLSLSMGQCEAACQVKNAHELFTNTLHMINVARGKSVAAGDDNKEKGGGGIPGDARVFES